MKIDEVPQDDAYLIEGKIRDLCYAVDKDGNYTSALSLGWKPKNEAMRLAWEQVYEQVEEKRQLVLAGKLSPIAFYMELNIMTPSLLAEYTGYSRWKIKRHLKMKHFVKLGPEVLAKYAEALNITPAELVDTNRLHKIVLKHED
jgi:hypothetical protein